MSTAESLSGFPEPPEQLANVIPLHDHRDRHEDASSFDFRQPVSSYNQVPGLAQWVLNQLRTDQPAKSREEMHQSWLEFQSSLTPLNPGE